MSIMIALKSYMYFKMKMFIHVRHEEINNHRWEMSDKAGSFLIRHEHQYGSLLTNILMNHVAISLSCTVENKSLSNMVYQKSLSNI